MSSSNLALSIDDLVQRVFFHMKENIESAPSHIPGISTSICCLSINLHDKNLIAQLHDIVDQSILVDNGSSIPMRGSGKTNLLNSQLSQNVIYVCKLLNNLLSIY